MISHRPLAARRDTAQKSIPDAELFQGDRGRRDRFMGFCQVPGVWHQSN